MLRSPGSFPQALVCAVGGWNLLTLVYVCRRMAEDTDCEESECAPPLPAPPARAAQACDVVVVSRQPRL